MKSDTATDMIETRSPASLPEDMPDDIRRRLRFDIAVVGTCYYTETADGYEWLNPLTTIRKLEIGEATDE